MKFNQLESVAEQYNIGKGKGDWFTLEAGDNKVRLVSEYEVLARHWTGKGKSTVCVGKDKGCIFCNVGKNEEANKPAIKFLMWVIDRRDGQFKIAEVGWTVVKAIGDLETDEEYAFDPATGLPGYDLNIKKTVKGSGTQPSDFEYSVIASRTNKPLTDEETAQIKELKSIKEIVETIKSKVLKEYQAMGIKEGEPVPPPDEEVPPPVE